MVVGGALAQDLFADRRNTDHVAEEVHHLLGARQAAEVTVNDDAVKAVVDESQQVTENSRVNNSMAVPLGVATGATIRGTRVGPFSRQAARLAERSGAAQEPGW